MFNGLEYISSQEESNHGNEILNGINPNELYQLITDRIMEVIEKDKDLVWHKPWHTKTKTGLAATNFVSKKPYRGINAFMLNMVYPILFGRNFKSPYFLTFKQVAELGGMVKKGSEGIEVFYYTTLYKDKDNKPVSESEYKNLRTKVLRKKATDSEKKRLKEITSYNMLRYYNVFSADDVTGIDFSLPNIEIPKNEFEKIEICESIIENYPDPQPKIIHKDGSSAFFMPSKDLIDVPELNNFKTAQEYYSTLFHELTHSTGVKKRLDRDMSREMYAFEELVAELGASYLNAESGILYYNIKNSAAYLKGWKKELLASMKKDNKYFLHAASAAQKSTDFILQYDKNFVPKYAQQKHMQMAGTEKIHCAQSLKHIQRYAKMDGKEYQPFAIANFIRAIEKDMKGLKLNDQSGLFKTVRHIHTQLVAIYKEHKDCETITIEIENPEKYMNLVSEYEQESGLGFWPHMVTAAISEGARHLAHRTLFKNLPMGNTDLQKKETDLPAYEEKEVDELVRSDTKIIKPANTFRLPSEVGKFLQDLQPYKCSIVITGDPHAGKTEFLLQMINAFCSAGKKVALFSLEQGGLESKDTLAAIDRNVSPANRKNLFIASEAKAGINTLKKYADQYDAIFVDSWQKLNLPSTKFDTLRHEHPKTIWGVIFQQNGEGGTRGGVATDYDTPIHIKVHKVDTTFKNNYAEMKKNRGNELNLQYNISQKKTKRIKV